jgi:hypothetical protein
VDSFNPENPVKRFTFGAIPAGDLEAMNEARRLKAESWANLNLRQSFADEQFMRHHIKAAGLRCPNRMEPATVCRLRVALKRAGVFGPEVLGSLGTTLGGFLELNPSLPLWAALALALESSGRFTDQAFALGTALGDTV